MAEDITEPFVRIYLPIWGVYSITKYLDNSKLKNFRDIIEQESLQNRRESRGYRTEPC